MTCFSSLYSFILRFYRLLIVSGGVNLVWHGRSLSQGALIRDDKCPYIIYKHPWTKGSGHTRLDKHHHCMAITTVDKTVQAAKAVPRGIYYAGAY